MDYVGSDFNSTGSVIAKSELTAARLKRGECVTCGRRCFKKTFFKLIPIDDEEGKVLNGRCLNCKPLPSKTSSLGGSSSNSSSVARSSNSHPRRRHSSAVTSPLRSRKSNGCSNQKAVLNVGASTSTDGNAEANSMPFLANGSIVQPVEGHRRYSMPTPPMRSLSSPFHSRKNHLSTTAEGTGTRMNIARKESYTSKLLGLEDLSTLSGSGRRRGPFRQNSFGGNSLSSYASRGSSSLRSNSTVHTSIRCDDDNEYDGLQCSDETIENSYDQTSRIQTQASMVPSKEELEHAAFTILAAASSNDLDLEGDDEIGAIAASLQKIVQGSRVESVQHEGVNDAKTMEADPHHKIASIKDRGLIQKQSDARGISEDKPMTSREDHEDSRPNASSSPADGFTPRGVLNRGGAFPMMRYGRHIYTGSTRTLSSMSSIDEGDYHPQSSTANTTSNLHLVPEVVESVPASTHRLKSMMTSRRGSSRTLGSLSTIDGTGEDEVMLSMGPDAIKSSAKVVDTRWVAETGASNGIPTVRRSWPSSQNTVPTAESSSSTDASIKPPEVTSGDGVGEIHVGLGWKDLLQNLQDSSSTLQSIEAIESLLDFVSSIFDPLPIVNLFIEEGIIEAILNAMKNNCKSARLQAKACELIASIAASCGEGSSRQCLVYQKDIGEAILFVSLILHEENRDVQEAGLTAIQCICEDCEANQNYFVGLDVIEPILRAMEYHRNEVRVQETGSSLITILGKTTDVQQAIGENGGIPVVLRAILVHLHQPTLVESCVRALDILVKENTRNREILLDTLGSSLGILDAMRIYPKNLVIQEIGCAMLADFTGNDETMNSLFVNGQASIEESGQGDPRLTFFDALIEGSLDAIQAHTSTITIQNNGWTTLVNLLESPSYPTPSPVDQKETRLFLVDIGALDAIVLAMVLHKENAKIQELTCKLLLLLAVDENHRPILASNPIELVKSAAKKFPNECEESAQKLLQVLKLEAC